MTTNLSSTLTKRTLAIITSATMLTGGLAFAGTASAAPAEKAGSHSARSVQGNTIAGHSWSYTGTWTDKQGRTGEALVQIVPQKFWDQDGTLMMRSAVTTTAEGVRGSKAHTKVMDLPVRGVTSGAGAAGVTAASCDILNLDLGPLDLNLLGLEIHLQEVILDIVATSGAGQLLGNLLCAVAGLLDGGVLLGQLSALLNQILGILNGLGI